MYEIITVSFCIYLYVIFHNKSTIRTYIMPFGFFALTAVVEKKEKIPVPARQSFFAR